MRVVMVVITGILAVLASAERLEAQSSEPPQPPERASERPPTDTLSPGSLFTGFEPHVDWVTDLRAKRVGDLVTIRIVENVRARQQADTESNRDTDLGGGIASLFGLEAKLPSTIVLDPLLGASSSTSFSGGGANTRTNSLNATITATVTEVLQNGYMRVEASRIVKVNDEEERLTVRGTIRPYDIGPRNEVLSTSVADVEILYGGKGTIGANLKPGFLFRLIRWIF